MAFFNPPDSSGGKFEQTLDKGRHLTMISLLYSLKTKPLWLHEEKHKTSCRFNDDCGYKMQVNRAIIISCRLEPHHIIIWKQQLYSLPHTVDNANVKCKITPCLQWAGSFWSTACGPSQQDKPANVSAELRSSSAEPWGYITSDVHLVHLMKCSHLHCHETKCFSILKQWRTTDCCS